MRFEVANFTAPEPRDARSCLLNLGIAASQSRYLAFLDHDDTIFQSSYRTLIDELTASQSAIAFGSVAMKFIDVFADALLVNERRTFPGDSLIDLFIDNFCPIHSYVVDRAAIEPADLRFSESLSMLEDYDFLLRICAKYASSFRLIHKFIGDYYFKSDLSNTLPGATEMGLEISIKYRAAANAIQRLKETCRLSDAVQRQLGIYSAARPITIEEALKLLKQPAASG